MKAKKKEARRGRGITGKLVSAIVASVVIGMAALLGVV